ncbi:FAD/FMN-containing dehydrogenase [Micrococcales bacterium KH10]|nr:FAD/FMN-containing dehydrogenase [Micrococcales bacterium KH10]
MTSSFDPAIAALRARLGEKVSSSVSADWAEVAQPWNVAITQHPVAVVAASDVADLRAVLEVASDFGVGVTTQLTGHGANLSLEGSIVIRPAGFDLLEIDARRKVARIGAGVRWGQVTAALDGTGLVAAFGSNPSVGVVGYLLAGGVSLFSRATGLGVRALRGVELLTADGQHRWVTDDDGMLMWALRGAGGSLGIVTAVELDLYEALDIYGGKMIFALEEAGDVLDAVLAHGVDADPALNMSVTLAQLPSTDDVSDMLQGQRVVSLDAFGFDDEASHMRTLDAIRAAIPPIVDDALGHLAVSSIHKAINEPTRPSRAADFSRLTSVDRPMIDDLVDLFASDDGQVVRTVQVRLLGGVLTEPPTPDGIAGAIHDPHLVLAAGPDIAGDDRVRRSYDRLDEIVRCEGKPRTVASFLSRGQTYRDAYDDAALERWFAVRDQVNPDGIIHSNRDPQRPAATS